MSAAPPFAADASSQAYPRKRFTREEVDQLLNSGFFVGQRCELIDGDLVDKAGQMPPHAQAIRLMQHWLLSFLESGRVQVQLPIEAAPEDRERSVPEPDVAVLREFKSEYNHRHPDGGEVLLVVEVADTSAAFDLSRKAVLYARSGVGEYWVLDLTRGVLVVHRQPDGAQYRLTQLYSEDEMVAMEGRAERVRVRELLPR